MRTIIGAAFLSTGAILLLPAPLQAQVGDAPLPVSLDRIRAALAPQQPPLLRLPAPSDDKATFRVEVREPLLDLQAIEEKPFDLTYGLLSAGELLASGIGKIRSSIVNYKRGRAERRARKEVEDALAAFFAYNSVPRRTTSATEK
jgi:hypothetical protein